jgi:hypothetical protein
MIAFCEPLALWSPSFKWMEYKKCPVSSEELLRYIKTGHVRVFGRKKWLTDEAFRNTHYKNNPDWSKAALWTAYDDDLLKIYDKDLNRKKEERRVCSVPDAIGSEYADRALKQPNNLAVREAKNLIRRNQVPGDWDRGYRNKPNMPLNKKVHEVLTNSYNNILARKQTQSDLMIFPVDYIPPLFVGASRNLSKYKEGDINTLQLDQFLSECVNILSSLKTFSNEWTLNRFMNSRHRKELIDWYDRACEPTSPLIKDASLLNQKEVNYNTVKALYDMIDKGLINEEEGIMALVPKDPYHATISMVRAITEIVAIAVAPLGFAVAYAPLVVHLIEVGNNYLEVTSRKPVSSARYRGIQAPFIAQTGGGATLMQIKRMRNSLKKQLDELKNQKYKL